MRKETIYQIGWGALAVLFTSVYIYCNVNKNSIENYFWNSRGIEASELVKISQLEKTQDLK